MTKVQVEGELRVVPPTIVYLNDEGEDLWFNTAIQNDQIQSLGVFSLMKSGDFVEQLKKPEFTTPGLVIIEDGYTNWETFLPTLHNMRPKMRIIIMSGAPGWRDATKAILNGAFDYIRKPSNNLDIFTTFKDGLIGKRHNLLA